VAKGWKCEINSQHLVRFAVTNKKVNLPSVRIGGPGKYEASPGDLVIYEDGDRRAYGRVLGRVSEPHDVAGRLAVMQLGDNLSHGYVRFIDPKNIAECYDPQNEHGSLGRFLAFWADVPINAKTIPELIRELDHGAFNDRACDRAVTRIESRGVRVTPPPASKIKVSRASFEKVVDNDDDADLSWAEQEGFEEDLAALKNGDLTNYGVRARVEIQIPLASTLRHGYQIAQNLESPGIWGVTVANSDDPYIDEAFKEECNILAQMLTALGIEVTP
jgi:hypothetical protein